MSGAVFSKGEPFPVMIGDMLLYCEKFTSSGGRRFAEKSTVGGELIYANTNKKSLMITFEGRVCDEDSPLSPLVYTYGIMDSDSELDVTYKGTVFSGCRVQAFSAQDSCEGYIYASVTLISPCAPVKESEGE